MFRMYKALKEASSFSAEQHNLLNADFDAPCNLISDDVVNNLEKLHTFVSCKLIFNYFLTDGAYLTDRTYLFSHEQIELIIF